LGRNHFETDITVACQFPRDYRGINAEPALIVEIQSPSTERDDHFVKLPQYQAIPSLMEILYIESETIGATVYRRQADEWETIEIAGPEPRLELYTIGLDVQLGNVYRGVPSLSG
jgi:Uma2 family endonuclease